MIQIPMHSRGAFDCGTLPAVNTQRPSSTYSADNILSVNTPKRSGPSAGSICPQSARQPVFSQAPPPQTISQPGFSPSASAGGKCARAVPALQKTVQKGQKVSIGGSGDLSRIHACFGWNVTDHRCDVDVSAFLLDGTGKVIGDSWFIFYGQPESPDKSTRLMSTASDDREIIAVNLSRLSPAVRKIVFVMTIHEALDMRLHFGMLKDAYIRILNPADNRELVSFRLTDYYTNIISMMIGEIYQHNGMWKFSAIGNGIARDLAGLCAFYGVEVC